MAKCDCQTGFFPYVRVENFEGEGKKKLVMILGLYSWKLGYVLKWFYKEWKLILNN